MFSTTFSTVILSVKIDADKSQDSVINEIAKYIKNLRRLFVGGVY